MKEKLHRDFTNGSVYLLHTEDGYPIETTDTFLPFYTKDAIGRNQNSLSSYDIGDRSERYLIGVSVMSGCPVRCKFCATANLRKWRNLTAEEIVEQVQFVVGKNPTFDPLMAKEFKINYTRMGEPFLNIDEVKKAIQIIDTLYPNTHHYVSTIGIKGANYTWIRNNVTLQVSLHSLVEENRDWLIPYNRKVTIAELGQIRTDSKLKTTVNLTLVNDDDFDIEKLKQWFDPRQFFIKLSPINPNDVSEKNELGSGVIKAVNLV